MAKFQESEVCAVLMSCPDKKTSALAKDTALVKQLTKVFNATLEIAKDAPNGGGPLTLALAKKAVAISGGAEIASGSQGLKLANFAANQTLNTVKLLKMAGYTPVQASIAVSLVMADKIVGAAGLGNFDKCKMAIASLSVTGGTAGFTCVTAGGPTLGLTCLIGAISVAAAAFDYYGQCHSGSSPAVTPQAPRSGQLP